MSETALPKEETYQLLLQWRNQGDRSARKQVIEGNLGLVYSIIPRFSHNNLDKEDLIQIGMIGLMKAVDKFDPNQNTNFSTYAVPVIIGELKTFLRDNQMVRVSRSLKELHQKAENTKNWMSTKLNRTPTMTEIAEELNVTTEELAASEEANQRPISLEQPQRCDEDAPTLRDRIKEDSFTHHLTYKITIQELLSKLDKQKRRLLVMRFFLEKSQREVAETLGITQVQVSRMERRLLEKLRKEIQF